MNSGSERCLQQPVPGSRLTLRALWRSTVEVIANTFKTLKLTPRRNSPTYVGGESFAFKMVSGNYMNFAASTSNRLTPICRR